MPSFRFEWAPDEKRRDFGIAVNDTILQELQNGSTIDEAYNKANDNGEALQLVPVIVTSHAELVQRKKLCEGIVPLVKTANIDMREAFVAIGEAATFLDALSIVCAWIKIVAQQKDAFDRERGAFVEEYTKQQRDLVEQLQKEVDQLRNECVGLKEISEADKECLVETEKLADELRKALQTKNEQLLELTQKKQVDKQQSDRAETLAAEVTSLRATSVDLRAKLEKAIQERDVAYASFRNGNNASSSGASARTEELEARLRQTTEQMRALEKRVLAAEEAARETNTQLVRLNGELVAGNLQRREASSHSQQQQQQLKAAPQMHSPVPPTTAKVRHTSPVKRRTGHGMSHTSGKCTCGWCS